MCPGRGFGRRLREGYRWLAAVLGGVWRAGVLVSVWVEEWGVGRRAG